MCSLTILYFYHKHELAIILKGAMFRYLFAGDLQSSLYYQTEFENNGLFTKSFSFLGLEHMIYGWCQILFLGTCECCEV